MDDVQFRAAEWRGQGADALLCSSPLASFPIDFTPRPIDDSGFISTYAAPFRRRELAHDLRCRGERGFALLTQRWAALQHVTASPSRISGIARGALVLTQFEHKYIR